MSKSGKISIVWTIVLSVVSLLLIGALAIAFKMADAGKQVQAEIAAIAARGEPVDVSQLGGLPIPAHQNAANDYAAAFAILSGPGADAYKKKYDDCMWGGSKPLSAAQWNEAEEGVNHFEKIVPMVDMAMTKPACKFPVNWSAGAGALFPHFVKMRDLARFLSARSLVAAHKGDINESAKSMELGIGASESLRGEPTLIGLLVHVAMLKINTYNLREAMNIVTFNETQAKAIDDALAKVNLTSDYRAAMIGERAFGLSFFYGARKRGIGAITGSSSPSGISPSGVGNNALVRSLGNADMLYYLRAMQAQIDDAALTSRELKLSGNSSMLNSEPPRYAFITSIIMPVFSTAREARDAAVAEVACARIALGLQAYKSKYGSYPVDLSKMQSSMHWRVPLDPFSGKSIIYKRQSKGFLLYSIGINMIDESGKYVPNSASSGDIVWRIKR